jgi:hypothetical protein
MMSRPARRLRRRREGGPAGPARTEEKTVKYLLMTYGNRELWESFNPEDIASVIEDTDAFIQTHAATGELLGAYGLADVVNTRQVRVQNGVPAVTDGPYLEAKEYLSSFYLVDVESPERAHEIAAALPSATIRPVEVWPVMHEGSIEP